MTFLLLPGLDGTGLLFESFLSVLPDSEKALVVSFPTRKKLGYDELYSIVTAAVPKEEPFVIIAESFSGPLGIRLAASKPKNLVGMVLAGSFAVSPVSKITEFFIRAFGKILFRWPPPRWVIEKYLTGKDENSRLLLLFQKAVSQVPAVVLHYRLKCVFAENVEDLLSGIFVPVLYLAGKRDRVVGEKSLRVIQKLHPATQVVRLDAPHLILESKPAESWKVIEEFLLASHRPE